MVSFVGLTLTGDAPIYQQMVSYYKRRLLAGEIANGEELPSRRLLSVLLSVNPNTVQKAFRQLEEEGLVTSSPGAKSLAIVNGQVLARVREEQTGQVFRRMLSELAEMGLSKAEAHALLDRFWDEEEGGGEG